MEPKKLTTYPQLAKSNIIDGSHRPNPENRAWAKFVDLSLIQFAGFAIAWFSSILALLGMGLLWTMCDRLNNGQSPGKWLFGLHTIESRRGSRPKYYQSFVRNTAFYSLNIGILLINTFLGKLFFIIGLACILFELYCVFEVASGVRVGDIVGATRVFDFKDEHTKFIEQFLKDELDISEES